MSVDFNFSDLTNSDLTHLKSLSQSKIDKIPLLKNFKIDKFNIDKIDPQIELRSISETQKGLNLNIKADATFKDLFSIKHKIRGKELNSPFYLLSDLSFQLVPDLDLEIAIDDAKIESGIDIFVKGVKSLKAESVFVKCDEDAFKELSLRVHLPPLETHHGVSHIVKLLLNRYLKRGVTISLDE